MIVRLEHVVRHVVLLDHTQLVISPADGTRCAAGHLLDGRIVPQLLRARGDHVGRCGDIERDVGCDVHPREGGRGGGCGWAS